jgi:hypothetical protein
MVQAANFIARKVLVVAVKEIFVTHYIKVVVLFGPKPHGYDIKLNRKVKDLAKISALSFKAKDNAIVSCRRYVFGYSKNKKLY